MLGRQRFANLDLRIRVKGGGHVSQMYAVRQAIAKAIVAYYQKYVDEQSKKELKDALLTYDRTLLVADPRRMEPKSSAVAARALVSRSPTVDRCGTSGVGFVGTRRDAGAVRAPFLVALEGVIQVIISVLKRLVSRMRK